MSYISVPKFKSSHELKGFAFVEFEEKNCAKEAVKFFENAKATEEIVGKFPKSHKIITDLEKKIAKVKESIAYYDQQGIEEVAEKRKFSELSENGSENCLKKIKMNDAAPEEAKASKPVMLKNTKSLFENLQVISKKKWLQLKEEFLEKQKNEIASLKQHLLNLNDQLQDKLNSKYKAKHGDIKTDDIVKGCVIKATLSPTDSEFDAVFKLTRSAFKNKYLTDDLDHVAYVDVEKNSSKVLIRCKSSQEARELMTKKGFLEKFSKSLLVGSEEIEYFDKIYSNREKKLNKKEKKKENKMIKEALEPRIKVDNESDLAKTLLKIDP